MGNGRNLFKRIVANKYIYLLLLPVLAYYIIFKYIPIYGLQLAFKDYSFGKGIYGSAWNGLENFRYLWMEPEFWRAFKNTIIISLMKLVIGFPAPIILSIALNELVFKRLRKTFQVIFTFPHFLSWVILSSICFNMLSSSGAINNLLVMLGGEKIPFLTDPETFRWLLVLSDIWKEAGWSTIIYMATILGIDHSLYEAAEIDGANRWQKICNITWPGIKSVVVTMLILQLGNTMSAGFMQIINLYNPSVYSVADILDTYIYRISFLSTPDFGVSTASGLFVGVVNFILLFIANKVAKMLGESGVV